MESPSAVSNLLQAFLAGDNDTPSQPMDEAGSTVRSLSSLLSGMMTASDATVANLRSSLASSSLRVRSLEDEVAVLEQKRAEGSSNALNAELHIAVLSAEVASLQERATAASKTMDQATSERSMLVVELDSAKEKLTHVESKLAAEIARGAKLARDLESQSTLATANAAKLAIATERAEVERKNYLDASGELFDASRTISHHEESIRSLRAQLVTANSSRSVAESQLSLSLQRFQQCEESRRRLELDAAEHTAIVATMKYKTEDLMRDRSVLQDKNEQLATLLQKSESKSLSLRRELESSRAKIAALEDIRRLQDRTKLSIAATPLPQRAATAAAGGASVNATDHDTEPSVLELLFRDSQRRSLDLDEALHEACIRLDEHSSAIELLSRRCCDAEAIAQVSLFTETTVRAERDRIAGTCRDHADRIRVLEGDLRRLESALNAQTARAGRAESDKLTSDEQADRARQELDAVMQRSSVTALSAAVAAKKLRQLQEDIVDVSAKNRTLVAQLDVAANKTKEAEMQRQSAMRSADAAGKEHLEMAARHLHGELLVRELELKVASINELHDLAVLRAVAAELMVTERSKSVAALEGQVSFLTRRLADADHRCETLRELAGEADARADDTHRRNVDIRKSYLQLLEERMRLNVRLERAEDTASVLSEQVSQLLVCVGLLEHRCRAEEAMMADMTRRVKSFTSNADVLTRDEAREWLQRMHDVVEKLQHATPVRCRSDVQKSCSDDNAIARESEEQISACTLYSNNITHFELLEYMSRLSISADEANDRTRIALSIASSSSRAFVFLVDKLDAAECIIQQCLRYLEGNVAQDNVKSASRQQQQSAFFLELMTGYLRCASTIKGLTENITERIAAHAQRQQNGACYEGGTTSIRAEEAASDSATLLLQAMNSALPVASLSDLRRVQEQIASDCSATAIAEPSAGGNSCDDGFVPIGDIDSILSIIRSLLQEQRQRSIIKFGGDSREHCSSSLHTESTTSADHDEAQFAASADHAMEHARRMGKMNEALREANSELLQKWEIVCDGHMYASAVVLSHMRRYVANLLETLSTGFDVAKEGLFVVAQRGVLLELSLERALPSGVGGGFTNPSSFHLASLGARAFMRTRIRAHEVETQTPPSPGSVDCSLQTDPWVDIDWTAQALARDHLLESMHHDLEEARDRLQVEQNEALSFSKLMSSDMCCQRIILERRNKTLTAEIDDLRRRMEEDLALGTKTALQQSSIATAQATQRLKQALDQNAALELELQRYRRELRELRREDGEEAKVGRKGAGDAAALSAIMAGMRKTVRPSREDDESSVRHSAAQTDDQSLSSDHHGTPPPTRIADEVAASSSSPPVPQVATPVDDAEARSESLSTRHVAELEKALSEKVKRIALLEAELVAERNIIHRGARQKTIDRSVQSDDFGVTPVRAAPIALPATSTLTPNVATSSEPIPYGLVLSGVKEPETRIREDDHPSQQQQFQERQMLLALSRSERQARFRCQEIESKLDRSTKLFATISKRCRHLRNASTALENEMMASHDSELRAMHRASLVGAVSTQTAAEEFPGYEGGRVEEKVRPASLFASIGAVLGGRR